MKNRNAVIWRRSERVPKWFRAVLHAIMYSEAGKAHSMICAIDQMLECSADERVLIVLCAMGLEQAMIAELLAISRFSVRRRLDSLRERRNFDFVAAMATAGDLSPLLVCFAEVCEAEEAYIAFAARRLAGLSEKELGVLFAIVKEEPMSEKLLGELAVKAAHYFRIKKKLIGMFRIGFSSAMRHPRNRHNYRLRESDYRVNACSVVRLVSSSLAC